MSLLGNKLGSKIGFTYVLASTLISLATIGIMLFFLVLHSWDAIAEIGVGLFSHVWHPPDGKYGILATLYGSSIVTILSLLIALPTGMLAAIFTAEILPQKHRLYIKSLLEILAGIPSIIYGLIGIAFIAPWIGDIFSLPTGSTIFTAIIVLSIMILPTIISLIDDVLYHIPNKYREAALSVGLYKYEIIMKALLPIIKIDIIGIILLALGRVIGETMAVMLVIGSIDKIPTPIYNLLQPSQTITSKLGREITEAVFGSLHFSSLIFTGLLLLIIVFSLTTLVQFCCPARHCLHE